MLKRRAYEHKLTPTIGRSHGIHAEPVTFGLKLAQAYAEFARNRARLAAARADIATCAISGAVGTFANIDPAIEAHVAKELGLTVEPTSTQVIPRDRHAMFFAVLGVIASSIERLAVEIRHLQRTEVLEAEEYFAPGQKGSSAMPHKRNPVLTENLTGLARVVRAAVVPAMENVALWHERDISHSSVERFIGPDACITLDFALARLTGVIDKLLVYPERMQRNIDRMGGLVHSQRVLLALTQAGLSREDSYALVQRNAMKVWESDGALALLDLLKADAEVTARLSDAELEALFDLDYHFRRIDLIFERVFSQQSRTPCRQIDPCAQRSTDGRVRWTGSRSSSRAALSCLGFLSDESDHPAGLGQHRRLSRVGPRRADRQPGKRPYRRRGDPRPAQSPCPAAHPRRGRARVPLRASRRRAAVRHAIHRSGTTVVVEGRAVDRQELWRRHRHRDRDDCATRRRARPCRLARRRGAADSRADRLRPRVGHPVRQSTARGRSSPNAARAHWSRRPASSIRGRSRWRASATAGGAAACHRRRQCRARRGRVRRGARRCRRST